MIYITDQIGRPQPCKYLIEFPNFQPKTKEIFWVVMAIGYDGIRRVPLFTFKTEKEMHKKYTELRREYIKKTVEEIQNG